MRRDVTKLLYPNYSREERVDWQGNVSDVFLLLMLSLVESGQHDTFPLCGARGWQNCRAGVSFTWTGSIFGEIWETLI